MDNCSTCTDTIDYLKNVNCKVIFNKENKGPWIRSDNHTEIYNSLPDRFILTDPDLEFNENLPSNFIEILVNLSEKYKCHKIGFALDISDFDKMYQTTKYFYDLGKNIYECEIGFWQNKINAAVDTTFGLFNKNYLEGCQIRVAGNFTAKHLPWYINNKIYNPHEKYLLSKKQTNISTISKTIISYYEKNSN